VALRAARSAWPQTAALARWAWAGGCCGRPGWRWRRRGVGINFLLSVLCLVWMADIAAYFGGRAFGRRKLAPSISPGKSWEGVWSGMAGVLLLAPGLDRARRRRLGGQPQPLHALWHRLGRPGLLLAAAAVGA
jgi:phosphatidate cytidylyltransferase